MEVKVSLLLLVLCVGIQDSLGKNLTKVLLTDEPTGAVCLDGSPPGYYIRKGSGEGANKWVLHMMGGGWCVTAADCYNRSKTTLGSSKEWPESYQLFGLFSDNSTVNPDFYNWNEAFLMYCDGGSFAGDVEKPDEFNGTKIYYRGYRNLKALLKHLNEKEGLSSATDVILTGCSAGGLAVYLHADFVHRMIKPSAKYRAFADAGYFIDIPDVNGSNAFPDGFGVLQNLQNINEAIIPACRAKYGVKDLAKCLFAPYDAIILNESYGQPCLPPKCSAGGMKLFEHYEAVFNQQVKPVLSSPPSNGYFLDSCFVHCQTFQSDLTWSQYAIKGSSIAKTFGDWYFGRSANTRLKDCEDYPCNPSCSKVPSSFKFY